MDLLDQIKDAIETRDFQAELISVLKEIRDIEKQRLAVEVLLLGQEVQENNPAVGLYFQFGTPKKEI